ncbi:unnamed protein product [Cylindrotheca closterium]|uniref:Uncharacterized protein n=1 Tax=Cylindrotheca closterium TaxID=2856 RepID=A0AAD2CF08_9STRA|nr:unnamed protein product [Cylindrotheca closterium]
MSSTMLRHVSAISSHRTYLHGTRRSRSYLRCVSGSQLPPSSSSSIGGRKRHAPWKPTTPLLSSNPVRWHASVFTRGWDDKEWHQQDFLKDATVKEKESWLQAMLKSQPQDLDVQAFLIVLNALAAPDLDDTGAPRRAEHVMSQLKRHSALHPTPECYQAAIQAWANANKENILVVVNRSERWLNELVAESENAPERIRPTIECYNAFLDALTRGRSGSNKRNQTIVQSNAAQAEGILRRLHSEFHHFGEAATVIPNTETFNFVIRGWTRCKHDTIIATKVLALLRLMESYQRENPTSSRVLPDTRSYSMAIDAFGSVAKMKARYCYEGHGFTSDPSMNGISELEEAHSILKYMHDLQDAGVKGVVPTAVPYNILITGWAAIAAYGHEDAPFRAEAILRTMISQKDNGFADRAPDRISFEKVMSAWANSKHPNAGKRANWWLKRLWNDAEVDSNAALLPTKTTYNIVMRALAKTDGAKAAETLLLTLGDKYKEQKEMDLCPNSESFAIVIRTWLHKAKKERKVEDRIAALQRAIEWLQSLQQVENEQNLSTSPELYLGVLRCATKCARRRRETLKLATETFEAMRNSRFQYDSHPYCLLLEVGLDALSGPKDDDERTLFVENMLADCSEDGLVSTTFLQAITKSRTYASGWTNDAKRELIHQLFSERPLPPSWSRNVSNPRLVPKSNYDGRIR